MKYILLSEYYVDWRTVMNSDTAIVMVTKFNGQTIGKFYVNLPGHFKFREKMSSVFIRRRFNE